jgi:hypothetical protein
MKKGKRGTASRIDGGGVRDWIEHTIALSGEERHNCVMAVERQQAFSKQGVVSTFHLGESYGILQGLAIALRIPLIKPGPKLWKKVVLANTLMDKSAAIAYVRERYPDIDMNVGVRKVIYHDGMADAMCIADWAYRQLRSGNGIQMPKQAELEEPEDDDEQEA